MSSEFEEKKIAVLVGPNDQWMHTNFKPDPTYQVVRAETTKIWNF